jgi:hypothetical protein
MEEYRCTLWRSVVSIRPIARVVLIVQLVDSCIKNGGDHFLAEIASKEFVDEMSGLIKSPVSRVNRLLRDSS